MAIFDTLKRLHFADRMDRRREDWTDGIKWVDGNKKRIVPQFNYGSILAAELIDRRELHCRLKYIT